MNGEEDGCYSSGSDDSSSLPGDMTEEEAMEIWLRRDRELAQRQMMRREDSRSRHDGESPAMAAAGEEPHEPRRRTSFFSINSGNGSADSDGEGRSPPEVPASHVQSSAAWRAALSRNRNPVDPAHQDAHRAYQRFIDMNRPGMAEAYIPSTPGLARMVERQREEDRLREEQRRRRDDLELARLQRIEEQQRRAFVESRRRRIEVERLYYGSGLPGGTGMGASPLPRDLSSGPQEDAFAAQVREYERLTQAHRTHNNDHQNNYSLRANNYSLPPASIASPPHNGRQNNYSSHRDNNSPPPPASVAAFTNNASRDESKKKKGSKINPFYLAMPNCTEYLTKPVKCNACKNDLYTHPLAHTFCCHCCSEFTTIREDAGGGWEEKMEDKGDWEGGWEGEQDVQMTDRF